MEGQLEIDGLPDNLAESPIIQTLLKDYKTMIHLLNEQGVEDH
jgi:DNA repair ATPase RecN